MIPAIDVPVTSIVPVSVSRSANENFQEKQSAKKPTEDIEDNHEQEDDQEEDEEDVGEIEEEENVKQVKEQENYHLAEESQQASQLVDEKSVVGEENEARQVAERNVSEDIRLRDIASKEVEVEFPRLVEKSLIIHRDEHGFGLRLKGQAPALVEHVHENGAAWRTGVRKGDLVSKVNGVSVTQLDHKKIVLMFKSCARFVGLTLLSAANELELDSMRKSFNLARRSSGLQQFWSSSLIGSLPMAVGLASDCSTSQLRQSQLRQRNSSVGQQSRLVEMIAEREAAFNFNPTGANPLNQMLLESSCKLSGSRCAAAAVGSEQLQCADCIASTTNHPLNQCFKCKSRHQRPLKTLSIATDNHQFHRTYGSLRQPHSPGATTPNTGQLEPTENDQSNLIQQHQIYHMRQSASTNSLPVEPLKAALELKKQVNRRLEIIREFIDTEKAHSDRLRLLDELFYKPLKVGGYMTSEQLRAVFSCHRTLYRIHRQIYRTLVSANDSNCFSEPMVGSALLEIFEGPLKRRLERAACSYCAAQATNIDLLNKLTRKDTKVGEFVAQVSNQQMIGRLGVKDLLASCFQRLTKYPLLLESLLKATPQRPSASMFASGGSQQDAQELLELELGTSIREDQDIQASRLRNEHYQALRLSAISLAEEREFIERALVQSRQILTKVNESIRVALARNKLKEIWRRTDKYPGVPLIDITNQQVVHEGMLTLRLSKRSFDVYMLLLNDYIIILTREGHDKYRLKFFTPESKSLSVGSSSQSSANVYSPVFVIDEHLTTRDAATDENGFYLLCKRKDDSRIYEFASRSPAERLKWRDRIQWTIERQMSRENRRPSCESTITKSSSEISAKHDSDESPQLDALQPPSARFKLTPRPAAPAESLQAPEADAKRDSGEQQPEERDKQKQQLASLRASDDNKVTNLEGTISYVVDDGIIMPSMLELSQVSVNQATQLLSIETSETAKSSGSSGPGSGKTASNR